ncbi:hypothetical protein NFI96_030949, partial [Prochilodus magdalenae]
MPLAWTNQISAQAPASKTLTITSPSTPVSEMERSRVALITLLCVLIASISGLVVEMRVKPGDNATIYCDCPRSARHTLMVQSERAERRGNMEMRNHDEGEDDEDEYDDFDDSVDIPSNEQTDLKKGTVEDSDLIYSEKEVQQDYRGVWFSRTSGAEVERRVRPGNDVTLHCDCVVGQRSELAWFRNCSDGSHPPLLLTSSSESFPRYGFVRNSSSKSYDLFVKNVMEKDLGLYYCARREKDLHQNTTRYHYGNLTTQILLR